jgi:hypothetical protein
MAREAVGLANDQEVHGALVAPIVWILGQLELFGEGAVVGGALHIQREPHDVRERAEKALRPAGTGIEAHLQRNSFGGLLRCGIG